MSVLHEAPQPTAVGRRGQRLRKRGSRFCAKAVVPSRWPSVALARDWACSSVRSVAVAPGDRAGVDDPPRPPCLAPGAQANYAAAKAGVVGFSLSLAKEVAPHAITVNVVSPRAVTDMIESIPAERREAFYALQARTNTLGRPGTPADVAPLVAFLCSADSAYVTGQVIVATGTTGAGVG